MPLYVEGICLCAQLEIIPFNRLQFNRLQCNKFSLLSMLKRGYDMFNEKYKNNDLHLTE